MLGDFLAALILVLIPGVSSAAGTERFDGMWLTTVSCSAARDALGYSFRFVSTVKDGVFHGQHGTPGEPSSRQIDGTIGPDGNGKLYAKGRTGSKEFVPGAGRAERHRVWLQHRGPFRRVDGNWHPHRGPSLLAPVREAVIPSAESVDFSSREHLTEMTQLSRPEKS